MDAREVIKIGMSAERILVVPPEAPRSPASPAMISNVSGSSRSSQSCAVSAGAA